MRAGKGFGAIAAQPLWSSGSLLPAGFLLMCLAWSFSEPAILFKDFYKAYFEAAQRLWQEGPGPTWPFTGSRELGFVNLPILAYLFVPLVPLGKDGATWCFFLSGVAAAALTWALLSRMSRPGANSGPLLLFAFLVNGPLIYSLAEGNTTHFILLLLVIALLLWSRGADYAAGLVLGLCGLIKLPLLLYGAYFALRGRWRVVAGGATSIGGAFALSVAVFGLAVNVEWFETCVRPFLGKVIPAHNVQSIDGFLIRLRTGSNYFLYWDSFELTRAHAAFRTVLFPLVFGAAFWLLWRLGNRPGGGGTPDFSSRHVLEYCFVLTLALVMSPLSWTHYYLYLLLPWGLYLGGQLALPDDAISRRLMWSGWILSSLPVVVFAFDPGWLDALTSRIVFSAWLFGGLCMLAAITRGLVWMVRARTPETVVDWPGVWRPALVRAEIAGLWGHVSPPLARNMLVFLALNAFVLNGVIWAVTPSAYRDSGLRHTAEFFNGDSAGDSWGGMAVAYDYLNFPHETPVYSEVFFNKGIKIQYPPSALFAIPAMRLAGHERLRLAVAYYGPWPSMNDLIGWSFIIAMIASVAALLRIHLRRNNVVADPLGSVAMSVVIAAGFTLTFYPIMKSYTLGQIQVWLNSLFALSLVAWTTSRKTLAGVLLGLVCLVKPHFGLFAAWALVRREWGFMFALAVTVAIGGLAALAVFGWQEHVDYLRMLSHMAERGETYYPNQSINGLLNRLVDLGGPDNLMFNLSKFPSYNAFVHVATVLTSSVILLAAICWRNKDDDPVIDFCRMAVSLTIASPIAWEHHYGILLPVFAVMFPTVMHDRRRTMWLIASYVLVSSYVPLAKVLAGTPLNIVQSYLLAGAFILLALLYRLRHAPAAADAATATPAQTAPA